MFPQHQAPLSGGTLQDCLLPMPNSGHPDFIFCRTRICPFITLLLMLQHSIYTVLPLSSAPGRHNPPPFPQSHDVTWHCVHLHHETQPAHRCEQTAGLHTASLGGTVHNTKLCKTGVSKCHLPVLQLLTQSWFSQEHWEGLQTELALGFFFCYSQSLLQLHPRTLKR